MDHPASRASLFAAVRFFTWGSDLQAMVINTASKHLLWIKCLRIQWIGSWGGLIVLFCIQSFFSPCYFCLCNFASFAGPCGEIFSSLGLLHKEVRGQDQPHSNTPSTVRGFMSRSMTHSTRILGLCWATPSSLCMDCYTPFCLHWEFALFLSFTYDAGFGSSSLNLSGQRTVILLPCHSSSPT